MVDNGSTDATATELRRLPWVESVRNGQNRGFAAGCNQGAALARGGVIVFLNNDTIVAEGWLEELLAPFADPEVGAVGPRSNNVSGYQLVEDVDYGAADLASIRAFAEQWRARTHARNERVWAVGGILPGGAGRGFPARSKDSTKGTPSGASRTTISA